MDKTRKLKDPQMHDPEKSDSDNLEQLIKLCGHELIGRKVICVHWMDFSDRLGLQMESDTSEKVDLCFGPMHWYFRNQLSKQMIVTSHEAFDTFRVPIEQLVGATITDLDISAEHGFALTVYFDNNTNLQLEPCEQFDDEIKPPCWQLFCSDGYVIKVGMQLGRWKRRHKTEPFWH